MQKQTGLPNYEEFSVMITEIFRKELREFDAMKKDQGERKEDKLLTKTELSELLGCSLQKLTYMMKNKDIPYYRIGRNVYFKENEILEQVRIRSNFRNQSLRN